MKATPPIDTEEHICRDCYKCLRECPVKAIAFSNGRARVDEEKCVWCGRCVNVCPVDAKQPRSERGKLAFLLGDGKPVYVSLAPSWVSDFPGISAAEMIHALKKIGFSGVSETAVGAEYVSAKVVHLLDEEEGRIVISSACPAVVEFCGKMEETLPGLKERVTPLFSPLLAHCQLLKEELGEDNHLVFIGPCIAKKREADLHPELLNCSLTFEDLRNLFAEAEIDLKKLSVDAGDEEYILGKAGKGALYPFEGGMVESVNRSAAAVRKPFLSMSFSGIPAISSALEDIPEKIAGQSLFLELLACEGGCVNGPMSRCRGETVGKRLAVLASVGDDFAVQQNTLDLNNKWEVAALTKIEYGHNDINEALRKIGKSTIEDELNCGGCGYNSCRDFAAAFLDGKAEETMCVSYMRSLAQEKANALIDRMPSGAVIVNDKMHIVECNHNFVKLIGEEALAVWEAQPRLAGAQLDKLVSFDTLFQRVLETGVNIQNQKIREGEKVLAGNIFVIQKNHIAGGIFYDITASWVNRDKIIENARRMITGNLETVQQIAYLLGENAAENEVMLNSIIESFASGTGVDDKGIGNG